jgi:hypothetical protein
MRWELSDPLSQPQGLSRFPQDESRSGLSPRTMGERHQERGRQRRHESAVITSPTVDMRAARRWAIAGRDRCDGRPRLCFMMITISLLVSWIGLVGFAGGASGSGPPKNIIILLADGVAAPQLEIAQYASRHLLPHPTHVGAADLRPDGVLLGYF